MNKKMKPSLATASALVAVLGATQVQAEQTTVTIGGTVTPPASLSQVQEVAPSLPASVKPSVTEADVAQASQAVAATEAALSQTSPSTSNKAYQTISGTQVTTQRQAVGNEAVSAPTSTSTTSSSLVTATDLAPSTPSSTQAAKSTQQKMTSASTSTTTTTKAQADQIYTMPSPASSQIGLSQIQTASETVASITQGVEATKEKVSAKEAALKAVQAAKTAQEKTVAKAEALLASLSDEEKAAAESKDVSLTSNDSTVKANNEAALALAKSDLTGAEADDEAKAQAELDLAKRELAVLQAALDKAKAAQSQLLSSARAINSSAASSRTTARSAASSSIDNIMKDMEAELAKLGSATLLIKQTNTAYESAQAEVDSAALELEAANKDLENTQKLLAYQTEVRDRLAQLLASQDAVAASTSTTQAQLDEVNAQTQALAQTLMARDALVQAAEEKMAEQKAHLEQAESDYRAALNLLETATEDNIRAARREVSAANGVLETALKELQAVKEDYENKLADLNLAKDAQGQAQAVRDKAQAALDAVLEKESAQYQKLVSQLKSAETALLTANKNLAAAELAVSKAESADASRASDLAQAEAALQKAQTDLSAAQAKLQEKESALAEQENLLATAQTNFTKIAEAYGPVQDFTLSEKYMTALREHSRLSAEIRAAEERKDNAKVTQLKAEKAAIERTDHKDGVYPIGLVTHGDELFRDINFVDHVTDDNTRQLQVNALDPNVRFELAKYAAAIINTIRDQFGTGHVTVNESAMDIAEVVANRYVEDNWPYPTKPSLEHNNIGINEIVENYGLLVPTNADDYQNGQYYEVKSSSQPAQALATMAALRQEVFNSIRGMMFSAKEWDHADVLAGLTHNGVKGYLGLDLSSRSAANSVHFIIVPEDNPKTGVTFIKDATKFDRNSNLATTAKDERVTKADYDRAKAEVVSAQTAVNTAKDALEAAKAAVSAAQAKVTEDQAAIQALHDSEGDRAKVVTARDAAAAAVTKAQAQVDQAKAALVAEESQVDTETLAKIQELRTAVASQEAALTSASQAVSDKTAVLEKAQAALKSVETQVTNKQGFVDTARIAFDKAGGNLNSLQDAPSRADQAKNRLTAAQTAAAEADLVLDVEKVGQAAARYLLAHELSLKDAISEKLASRDKDGKTDQPSDDKRGNVSQPNKPGDQPNKPADKPKSPVQDKPDTPSQPKGDRVVTRLDGERNSGHQGRAGRVISLANQAGTNPAKLSPTATTNSSAYRVNLPATGQANSEAYGITGTILAAMGAAILDKRRKIRK